MTDATADRRQWSDDTWVYLDDPRMPAVAHGWKLHISARPATLADVLQRVGPVLARHVCHAKHAVDVEVLRVLNSGLRSAGTVGKAVTVYPAPGTVVPLAFELVDALRGLEGPRVLSDLRVSPDAPVFYRYGPFEATYRTGAGGRLESVMIGPDGAGFDGLAVGRYRCPPWAVDPFAAGFTRVDEPLRAAGAGALGGGRYRITSGIARAAHGNVYRALDRDTGQPVVVKQARAFVAEDEAGQDARHRLRHEQRVVQVLDGVEGVPRLVDYFGYGSDEFLVTDDCGGRNLRRDVVLRGPWREPLRLADELDAILARIHARGVVVGDVKPDNVVLDASGRCHLVDFGISALDGVGPTGATSGYRAPGAAGPDSPDGDRYALGVTLGFAATGLDPVIIDGSATLNRDRTLAVWEMSGVDPAVSKRIRGLMKAPATTRLPPVPDDHLLDEIIDHTVAFCVAAARKTVRDSSAPIDLYAGSSGLGLELLHHPERPGVPAAVDLLAHWTARQSRDLSASLFSGHTGVALFLQRAGLPYDDHDLLPRDRLDGRPPEADLIEGAAGIGLGHLLLAAGGGTAGSAAAAGGPAAPSGAAGSVAGAAAHLSAAAQCHSLLTTGAATLTPTDVTKPGTAALAEGLAHGDAGVALFLVEYAQATGDPEALFAARAACDQLAALTPDLVAWARRPDASRRYGSWCRGLAGIGTVLIRAADRLSEPGYLDLAEHCAEACVEIAPRMPHVIQCCGLAGLGDFLVDTALARRDDRWWHEARTVARLILVRSGGTWARPDFPDVELTRSSAGWACGSTGVLGFLRRLRDRGGPRPGLEP